MAEGKVGKLYYSLVNLKFYFKVTLMVAKIWWLFAQLYDINTSTGCFVLEV